MWTRCYAARCGAMRGGTTPATDAATAAMDRASRARRQPRRTPRARLPDCEALDAAQVFGFAMKTPRSGGVSRPLLRPRKGRARPRPLKNNSGRDESVTARGLSPARAQSRSHCLRVRTITQQPRRLRA